MIMHHDTELSGTLYVAEM